MPTHLCQHVRMLASCPACPCAWMHTCVPLCVLEHRHAYWNAPASTMRYSPPCGCAPPTAQPYTQSGLNDA
eukprot:15221200-Alexandrium_andersonii.AAC.1